MNYRQSLSYFSKSLKNLRTGQDDNQRSKRTPLSYFRPWLEQLENRIVLNGPDYLGMLQSASTSVPTFASNLESTGALSHTLPIVVDKSSGNTITLGNILGVKSTFNTISNALSNIHANDNETQLGLDLNKTGSGHDFSVVTDNNDGITITYKPQSLSPTLDLSVANTVSDFFGSNQKTPYFSTMKLSGSGSVSFDPKSEFSITFGADSNGFFIENDSDTSAVFKSPDITATVSLDGMVTVNNLKFDVSVTGATGRIDLKGVNLALKQPIYSTKFGDVSAIIQDVDFSLGDGSEATISEGKFSASLFGKALVTWTPTVTWEIGDDGTLGQATPFVPASGNDMPKLGDQTDLQSLLAQSVESSLGLSKYNVQLDPIAQFEAKLPPDFQKVITFLTGTLTKDLDYSDPSMPPDGNPQDELNAAANENNGWTVTPNYAQLPSILEGNPGSIITFESPTEKFLDYSDSDQYDLGEISIGGIVSFRFAGNISFSAHGQAQIGFGIDNTGVFVSTAPNDTSVQFSADFNPSLEATLEILETFPGGKATLGEDLTTTATLELKNSPYSKDNKIDLSDIKPNLKQNQPISSSLSDLANWLQQQLDLDVKVTGDINLSIVAHTVQGSLNQLAYNVSPIVGAAASPFITAATSVQNTVVGETDKGIQALGSAFGSHASSKNVNNAITVNNIVLNDFAPTLVSYAKAHGADQSGTYVDTKTNDAILLWTWPHVLYSKDFPIAQILSGASPSSNSQSNKSDFIQYSVNGSTLNITGQAGTDTIRIVDLGGGNIELLRSGMDSKGTPESDPTVVLTGISLINATMNDSAGSQSSFIMDPSLDINTNVTSGAGNDTLITGIGDDTIHGGSGKDFLESVGGTNKIYAGAGDSTLLGGSGTDYLYGGSGDNILQAGSGTEYLYGGPGDDILGAFNDPNTASGPDTLYGGGGNDILEGGSGVSTLYGEGRSSDKDLFKGGTGTVTMYGGKGSNTYYAGTGTTIVHGGPASDVVNWQVGDGNTTVDGGVDPSGSKSVDVLQVEGSNGANGHDKYTVSKDGAGVTIAAPGATITAGNIQVLNIDDGLGGANDTVLNDLTGTSVDVVDINLTEIANPDGVLDTTTLNLPDGNKTVKIGVLTGTNESLSNKTGPVMYVTGAIGPLVFVTNQDDALNIDGGVGANQFNVLAVSGLTTINTKGGKNTINVGSNSPAIDGNLLGIQGALVLNGSNGTDTANLDDSAPGANRSGTLSPTTLTGLGMGASGITFSGLNTLNLNLGPASPAPLPSDTFNITEVSVPSLVTGPTYVLATQIPAGRLTVAGNIASVHVDTGTPGSFAGPVATVTLYEGYSPWTLQEIYTPPILTNPNPPADPPDPPSNPTLPGPNNPSGGPASSGTSGSPGNGRPASNNPPSGTSAPPMGVTSPSGMGQPVNMVSAPVNGLSTPTVGASSAAGAGTVPTVFVAPSGGSPPAAPPSPQPSVFSLFFDLFEMELNLVEMELSWLQALGNLRGLP